MTHMTPNVNEPEKLVANPDSKVSQDQVYNWLTRYYLHQDQLSWSRLQTIVAVEASALAASFYLDGKNEGVASWAPMVALVFGSVVTFLLWLAVYRDWEIRDYTRKHLDTVHATFGLRMTSERPITGRKLAYAMMAMTLIANIALAILFAACGSAAILVWLETATRC